MTNIRIVTWRRIVSLALLVACAANAGSALADALSIQTPVANDPPLTTNIAITPSFDAEAEYLAGSFVITDGSTSLRVARSLSFNTDERGVMEFDLSFLPSETSILSAELIFDINQRSGGGGTLPIVSLYGYAGDGLLQQTDADDISKLLGTTDPIEDFDPIVVPLDLAKVNQLWGESGVLGIVAYQTAAPHGVNIIASELAQQFPTIYTAPTLSIGYTLAPEPGIPGDANGDGMVDGIDYLIWATNYGDDPANDPPGSPLNGDYNDDGVVDGVDYIIWATNYSGSPSTTVPEPATGLLLVVSLAAVFIGRRR